MKPNLYFGIAAYNEENTIETCLESLNQQKIKGNLETIICLNGCTDKTEEKISESRKKYARLNISIIHSKKGISFAQKAITNHVEKDVPLLFVDADVTLEENCSEKLYDEIKKILL
ncbi:glycosyltransferase family 2 protein [Candidatus Woesearchaeota archaeon]|nr:glycosyltransferase family 2 protein [Candidatus Woesearchaeota archaeon]